MMYISQWQKVSTMVLAMGMMTSAIAPLALPTASVAVPAPTTVAQLFPSPTTSQRLAIPSGTRIPVLYDGADKVMVLPTETAPLTLKVARNIRATSGAMLIPAGSQVRGKLRPAGGGSQFYAEELILTDGTSYPMNATSRVVTRTEDARRVTDSGAILKGTAAGAGAATILSGVIGNRRITVGKVLAGAGAGALGGWLLGKRNVDVVVIDPDTDLTLTLNSNLALR